jgi:hypothetical protein
LANIQQVQLSDTEEIALSTYVHSPQEAQTAFVDLADTIYGTSGISAGSTLLDRFIYPNRPGWVRTWIARPGELKSTMLRIIAKTEAERIVRDGEEGSRYVAFITYEEAVDTQELHFQEKGDYTNDDFWSGRVSPKMATRSSMKRLDLPIWWFGDSMLKSTLAPPPMSINMVLAGIKGIEKTYGLVPSLILLDYIQEIQVEREDGENRTQKIIDGMGDLIRLGGLVGAPVELGSQAKQTSADKSPPIPGPRDGEYSYYPEQKSTGVNGIWRVWNTDRDNVQFQRDGVKLVGWRTHFDLTPHLTVFRPAKARHSILKMPVPVLVDPTDLTVTDIPAAVAELQR